MEEKDLPGLTDRQLTKIKSKMKSSWFKSLMLKKKVLATLDFKECVEKQILKYYHGKLKLGFVCMKNIFRLQK